MSFQIHLHLAKSRKKQSNYIRRAECALLLTELFSDLKIKMQGVDKMVFQYSGNVPTPDSSISGTRASRPLSPLVTLVSTFVVKIVILSL